MRRPLTKSRAAAPSRARPASTPEATSGLLSWLTHLVHAHRARLIRVVRREGLRAEDAFDCVQETFTSFLVLPQARQLAAAPEEAGTFLTVLARNIARNFRRLHTWSRPHDSAEAALASVSSPEASVDELIAAAEAHAMAMGCVTHLSEVQRRVVTLRLLDEVPGEDVARFLGMTPGHVAVLLHRAKGNLRTCMASAGYQEPLPVASGKR